MGILSFAKKGIKKVNGKGKKASGNKGNPGTNRKKKKLKSKKPVVRRTTRKTGRKTSAQNITSEVYQSVSEGLETTKDTAGVGANQVEAIGNLTKGNGKLMNFLQQATGSTSLLDWAHFFKALPRDKQAQIIAESRMDDKVDDSPSTIDKIKQYAMDAAGIYARATGKDINTGEAEAAALAAKEKQKTNTMFIIGGVIITVLIVVAVLFRSPGKRYV